MGSKAELIQANREWLETLSEANISSSYIADFLLEEIGVNPAQGTSKVEEDTIPSEGIEADTVPTQGRNNESEEERSLYAY
jgi:hypothetical protein